MIEKKVSMPLRPAPVEMVTRKIRQDGSREGILVYGYKFRPVMQ